jgi:hypothetical protein
LRTACSAEVILSAVAKSHIRLQEEMEKKRRLRSMIRRIKSDISNVKG